MLLHSPHSGCHCDSILGSHLAGMVSMTCSEGEGGSDKGRSEKHTRAISKVNYTYPPMLAPALNVMLQPAFPQRLKACARSPRMRLWGPAPPQSCGPWPMGGNCLFSERPFCPWLIRTDSKWSFMQRRRKSQGHLGS